MKKFKASLNVFTKISLLCFAFFVLSPSLQVQAVFSDTANINMGIKLELGTISLASEDTTIPDSVKFTEGNSVTIASSILVNNGSLSGKLAYKIDVIKENGSMLTVDELKNTVISIDFGTAANKVEAAGILLNANSCSFVKDTSGKDIVLEPDSMGKIPVTISYKSSTPTKEEKLKINVTFRLIQSNASNANGNMFSDDLVINNVVSLIPKVIGSENYWPAAETFVNSNSGKFKYSLEKMKMFYGETYSSLSLEKKQIKNLNKAVLYIQIPGKDPLTQSIKKEDGTEEIKDTYIFSQLTTGNEAIKIESVKLDEKHHGMIITIGLSDSYLYSSTNPNLQAKAYSLGMNIAIEKYSMYSNGYYGNYANDYLSIPFFATQLVLSSDISNGVNDWNFEYKTIPLSTTQNSITIKQLKGSSHSVKKEEFENIPWNKETINFEVIEKNTPKLISYLTIKEDKMINLWIDSNPNQIIIDATLNVKITGDTGITLVISRKLENSPQTQTTIIKSMKVPLINKETEEQIKQQSDTAKTIEKPNSTIDKTVQNEPTTEVPIEDTPQEDVDDGDEEIIDSSSIDSNSEIKEEIVPIENSDQTTPEEVSDD